MKPHELRVVEERKELQIKVEALEEFLKSNMFENLSQTQQDLLIQQLLHMTKYSLVLATRIYLFENGN